MHRRRLRPFARLTCWLTGCIPPSVRYGFPDDECERCGKLCEMEDMQGGAIGALRFWWRYRRPRWMRVRQFFEKCPDCGKRFGRHDDSKDRLPF